MRICVITLATAALLGAAAGPAAAVEPCSPVPDVRGLSLGEARAALARAGCAAGHVSGHPSSVGGDVVLSQRPRAGIQLYSGAHVALRVGRPRTGGHCPPPPGIVHREGATAAAVIWDVTDLGAGPDAPTSLVGCVRATGDVNDLADDTDNDGYDVIGMAGRLVAIRSRYLPEEGGGSYDSVMDVATAEGVGPGAPQGAIPVAGGRLAWISTSMGSDLARLVTADRRGHPHVMAYRSWTTSAGRLTSTGRHVVWHLHGHRISVVAP